MGANSKRIVIIGGVACGPKAAARARRCDPDAHITIIESGGFVSYAGCGMPYYIAGAVKEIDGLMTTTAGYVRDVEYFRSVKNIEVLTTTRADSIDRKNKTVSVTNAKTGAANDIPYDKLVISTGALPIRPPFKGMDLKGVYMLRSMEEAIAIRKTIEENMEMENAVIVGGGRISLEVTDAFQAQGVDTTIVELMDQLLATMLDKEMALYLENTLRKNGVNILCGEKVLHFIGGDDGSVKNVITDKRELDADMVIVAVGVKPNVELARAAGLDIGETGGILVNERMQTNDPDIYAGGDCVETVNLVTGKKTLMPLGSVANRQGRVIGDNVTGFSEDTFPGVAGTSMLKALDLNVGKTGLTESEAQRAGLKAASIIVPGADRSHFFPGGKTILLKLTADAESQRVLGVQVLGPGDMPRTIDTTAAALTAGMTLHDLANLDVGYAPPYASALSTLAHAANALRNKLDGLSDVISPVELKNKLASGGDFVLFDIRKPSEIEKYKIDDRRLLAIPMHELQERAKEIPAGKDIVVVCQIGSRSYEAARTVRGLGFDSVTWLEGGLSCWQKFFEGE